MSCMVEKIGFTTSCAAVWVANSEYTGQRCLGVCMRPFLKSIFVAQPNNVVDQDGNLKLNGLPPMR